MIGVLRIVIPALWLAWLLYWLVAARDVKPTRWRESAASQARHRVPLVLALIIVIAPDWLPHVLRERFLPVDDFFPALGTVMLAAGLGFAVWARRHLGRNWSASVTLKESHALIRTGPYRLVRHPIYTGMLLGFLGMAVAIGEWRALLAAGLALVAFALKSRVEEGRMRASFPEYEGYRRETAALIPFVF